MTQAAVHTQEISLGNNRVLGRLTLDNPKALNATRLDMIETLAEQLTQWETRPEVVAILLDANGDKAFCAGGDIVNLYRSITGDAPADYPERFFSAEYRLCRDMRRMQTPIIAWGHGLVMGGGCGLFSAASHRIATETTQLAMPEIKIGLFPDCLATWFFNRLPAYLSRFIALTGASLNAADTLFAGLADGAIAHQAKHELIDRLADIHHWDDPHRAVSQLITTLAAAQPVADAHDSRLITHLARIRACDVPGDLKATVGHITTLAEHDDAWLAACGRALTEGCPMTACLIDRQIRDGRYLSLDQCFNYEYAMALTCCEAGDFAEGVRALLIDKDKTPRWRHAGVADVPDAAIAAHCSGQPGR